MSDYADIADLSWENIQEPKTLPVGTYLLKGKNAVFQPSKEENKSPVVMFVFSPKEAMEDVKQEELEELGAEYDISENKIFHRVYIEDGSSWASVRNLLTKMGVEAKGDVVETLKKVKGSEVLGYLDQNTFTRKDGTVATGNNITEFALVE
jgi:hypothetical protein